MASTHSCHPRAVIIPITNGMGVFWEPLWVTDLSGRHLPPGIQEWTPTSGQPLIPMEGSGFWGHYIHGLVAISHKQISPLQASWWVRGLPCNHCRLGWVQHFFPSGEFRALPLLDWFLQGLLDSLFSGGGGRCSHHARRLSLLNWAGWHSLQGSYTFQDFPVWKVDVTLHLLPQLFHTFSQLATSLLILLHILSIKAFL